MEVNFPRGGHSLGVAAGAATHAPPWEGTLLIGGGCPCLFSKEANQTQGSQNRFVLCYSNWLIRRLDGICFYIKSVMDRTPHFEFYFGSIWG